MRKVETQVSLFFAVIFLLTASKNLYAEVIFVDKPIKPLVNDFEEVKDNLKYQQAVDHEKQKEKYKFEKPQSKRVKNKKTITTNEIDSNLVTPEDLKQEIKSLRKH